MTQFMLKNDRRGDKIHKKISRFVYKRIAKSENRRGRGGRARFETEYRDGEPVKMLTLMRRES